MQQLKVNRDHGTRLCITQDEHGFVHRGMKLLWKAYRKLAYNTVERNSEETSLIKWRFQCYFYFSTFKELVPMSSVSLIALLQFTS